MIVLLREGPDGEPETVEVSRKAVGLRDEATKRWYRPTGQTKTIEVEVWELAQTLTG